MPKKQVNKQFNALFLTHLFQINDLTANALKYDSAQELLQEIGSLRALSRKLASAEFYNGKPFNSMAKRFNVSIEAMAIRLEEMKLVTF